MKYAIETDEWGSHIAVYLDDGREIWRTEVIDNAEAEKRDIECAFESAIGEALGEIEICNKPLRFCRKPQHHRGECGE